MTDQSSENIIGLDLGGANLKFADRHGRAQSIPFPLWKSWCELEVVLRNAFRQFEPAKLIALTMTGELADCFANAAEGVEYLIKTTVAAANGIPVVVWQTSGEFVSPEVGCEFPMLTAAANWMALATWVARALEADETGLLIDIGSTTTDIIPLCDGFACPSGLTDYERIRTGELVYTGGQRTPLCAVSDSVRLDDVEFPLAAELFATMLDVYLILEEIPEDSTDLNTADGRPADIKHARQRLARMVCAGEHQLSQSQLTEMSLQFKESQQELVSRQLRLVLKSLSAPPRQIILSGSSEFIGQAVVKSCPELSDVNLLSLPQMLGPELASAACAHALVQLANERV
ncbi:MAG TPA: H4MPT-linked C1 transfer pathway protein [Planctomycetaceae bacterium]|nr:H4MPT-linked C1 transfer pathway protein [Planctomycetaceae bacterium]|tara:strand:+ start:54 stop:1088 length:1035 start_codon:yes stop_codon:yes gene_type:complete